MLRVAAARNGTARRAEVVHPRHRKMRMELQVGRDYRSTRKTRRRKRTRLVRFVVGEMEQDGNSADERRVHTWGGSCLSMLACLVADSPGFAERLETSRGGAPWDVTWRCLRQVSEGKRKTGPSRRAGA